MTSSEEPPKLHVIDYLVAAGVLVVPLVIGFVIAFRESKNMTRTDYLLGGRKMTVFPVAMSLFITFQSAVALLGIPSEVYMHGTGIIYSALGYVICYLVCSFTFVPLVYNLEVTSIYEYLDLRFQSRTVRMLSTILGCVQTIMYMSIALLSPALALQAVGGLPLWMSVILVGIIGTIYTCAGGIKSVIWTDVFQTVILYIGLIAFIVKGSRQVGGFSNAWSIANDEGRVVLDNFSIDPRVRMGIWGATIGAFCSWLGTCYNQSTMQRIRSMRSLKEAKLVLLVNIPFILSFFILLMFVGVVTYAYFNYIRCDAYKGNLVNNPNQISPYFVLHAMKDFPGLAGLYMAMLFSGSLSTLSSGINALAANTVEDILQYPLKGVNERTVTIITKIASAFFGVLISCMAYAAQYLKGPVTQMVGSVYGSFGSPILGMFLIGCMVPWANKYGALAGCLSSLTFTLYLNIGGIFYGVNSKPLPPAPVDQCASLNSSSGVSQMTLSLINDVSSGVGYNYSTSTAPNDILMEDSSQYEYGFFLNDISYEWYSVFGTVICMVVGMLVSYATRKYSWYYDPELVFPFCRRLWCSDSDKKKAMAVRQSSDCDMDENTC